jgi:hypothetical protein
MEKTSLSSEERAYLREVGGEPLEGSGHEEEARAQRSAEFYAGLRAVGSLTCLLQPDEMPNPPRDVALEPTLPSVS